MVIGVHHHRNLIPTSRYLSISVKIAQRSGGGPECKSRMYCMCAIRNAKSKMLKRKCAELHSRWIIARERSAPYQL